jgi:hypothetical protein
MSSDNSDMFILISIILKYSYSYCFKLFRSSLVICPLIRKGGEVLALSCSANLLALSIASLGLNLFFRGLT